MRLIRPMTLRAQQCLAAFKIALPCSLALLIFSLAQPMSTDAQTNTATPTRTLQWNFTPSRTPGAPTRTRTPTLTRTPRFTATPDLGATAQVLISASETAQAIASYTKTPTRTPSHTPTATPTPTQSNTPIATAASSNICDLVARTGAVQRLIVRAGELPPIPSKFKVHGTQPFPRNQGVTGTDRVKLII